MSDDLVTRLLIMAPADRGSIVCKDRTTHEMNADIREAAAEITRLKAVIAAKDGADGVEHLYVGAKTRCGLWLHPGLATTVVIPGACPDCRAALSEATPTEGEGA